MVFCWLACLEPACTLPTWLVGWRSLPRNGPRGIAAATQPRKLREPRPPSLGHAAFFWSTIGPVSLNCFCSPANPPPPNR